MSVEERVLSYLKSNPGATPRKIADALGVSLTVVRLALNKLRESGSVIRSSKGGYIVKVSNNVAVLDYTFTNSSKSSLKLEELTKTINELVDKVNELVERVSKLENEVRRIKMSLPEINTSPRKVDNDKLLTALKLRGIINVEEAKKLATKPLEDYVNYGKALIIEDFIVSPEFLSRLKSRFPLKISDLNSLSPEEQELLKVLIKAGHVYLYAGIEYRYLDTIQS